jgi:hypothetical protein
VSPEIWFEIILAYQRLKGLGRIALQAIKVFHKLQSESAFHFSSYSGGPSLCRVTTIIEDIRLQRGPQRRRNHPQYFQILVTGNEYLSSHSEEMSAIVCNGFGNHLGFLVCDTVAPIDAILLEPDDSTSEVNMDQEMRDFFGLSEERVREASDNEREDVQESTTLSLLEQLERDTVEVLGVTSLNERESMTNETAKRRKNNRRKVSKPLSSGGGERVAASSSERASENNLLALLQQLEQDSMEVLGRDVNPIPASVAMKKTRKKRGESSPQSKVDEGTHELSVLEQLEMESREVLGESPLTLPKVSRVQRKKASEKVPRSRAPTEKKSRSESRKKVIESQMSETTLRLLEQLERDTMEVLSAGEER